MIVASMFFLHRRIHVLLIVAGLAACGGKSVGTSSAAPPESVDAGCAAGRCLVVLASGQAQPGDLAVSATDVFWTTEASIAGGTIASIPLAGGDITTIASGQTPYGLAVDATHVYWTSEQIADDGGVAGAVLRALAAGGASTALAIGSNVEGIAVNATTAAWVTVEGSVLSVPLAGGAPTTLATQQVAYAIAVDDVNAYWVTYATPGGVLTKAPLGGGPSTALASEQDRAAPIAVDDANVYWMTGQATVMSIPKTGGTPTVLVPGPAPAQENLPFSLATDGASVYWTDEAGGTVSKVAVVGGDVTVLATDQSGPGAIAVDGTSVYWSNGGAGTTTGAVMRLTPK
jgi:hypothetical protein